MSKTVPFICILAIFLLVGCKDKNSVAQEVAMVQIRVPSDLAGKHYELENVKLDETHRFFKAKRVSSATDVITTQFIDCGTRQYFTLPDETKVEDIKGKKFSPMSSALRNELQFRYVTHACAK